MDRIALQELVRDRQIGAISRRDFLKRATAVIGSAAAANTLLVACGAATGETPPPVVDPTQSAAEVGTGAVGDLTTGFVAYPGPTGTELMGYLAHATDAAPRPGVIVIQEWWGVNDHIKDVTERFAREGYVALAPDLYNGVVTTEPDEARKEAIALSTRDAVGEIGAAMAYLRGLDFTRDAVGVVGFCMGGALVLQTAANVDDLAAGVVFYGSPLTPDEAARVSAPILTFLGTADSISATQTEQMHGVFEESGIANSFQLFDGAPHAFFNDTRGSYHPDAAADAWQQTLGWLRTHLGA